MKKPLLLTNEDGEIRALTMAEMRKFRPASEVLPAQLLKAIKKRKIGQRGPQVAPVKQQVTLRLDADVLDAFRATGTGWQSRINSALRRAASQTAKRSAW